MVALNFQPRFADDVESGRKTRTIRSKARCKPGDTLQLYTGQRTKQCRKLADAVCTSVVPVEIHAHEMYVDGVRLFPGSALRDEREDRDNDFAMKDGFEGFMEMADWFRDQYGALPFKGAMIEWRLA